MGNKYGLIKTMPKVVECKYTIGIDAFDKNALAYCLMRKKGDDLAEVLLCKSMNDEVEFHEEVDNLSKYFNAKIIK